MRVFALDLRAIALARMAIGLLILVDLWIRCQDIGAFYLPDGITPVGAMPSSPTTFKHLELYRHIESWWGVAGLMLVAAVFAISLTLGFYSRSCGLVSWYLLASIQNRNIYVNDGGDLTLKIFLFIGLFLPLGARWSIDAWRNPQWRKLPNEYLSPATVTMVLQFCVMYFTAGVLKSDPVWRHTGDALWLTLNIDQFSTGFARELLHHTTLLRALTFLVLSIEMTTPLLLLCPLFNHWTRSLSLVLLTCFHLGIASCMHLGLFMPICLGVLIFLWPTPWMNFLESRLPARPESPAVGGTALPSGYRSSWVVRAACLSIIVFIMVENFFTIPELGMNPRGGMLTYILDYGRSTGMMQNWTLFAPKPFVQDGWFVVEGTRKDGRVVDLLTGQPATYAKPDPVCDQFKNQRWRRVFQNLWIRWNPRHAPMFLRYMGRHWNAQHGPDDQITFVRLMFVQEMTQLPGIPMTTLPGTLGEFPSRWLEGERL